MPGLICEKLIRNGNAAAAFSSAAVLAGAGELTHEQEQALRSEAKLYCEQVAELVPDAGRSCFGAQSLASWVDGATLARKVDDEILSQLIKIDRRAAKSVLSIVRHTT